MDNSFLLTTSGAARLYEQYAKDLPIIDFHNHLSVADIAANRRYANIYELWLASDPYKHRLMRICGVAEHYITGQATPYEKFEKFCQVFPLLAGNPVFDWSRMELSGIFGIDQLPSAENARYLYDQTGEMLQSSEFFNNGILDRFHIEYHAPVATLLDDLSGFDGQQVAPSLRGDQLLCPAADFLAELTQAVGVDVTDTATYIAAVSLLLDKFSAAGCRFADHALDTDFFASDTEGKKADILVRLGVEYAKRGWTLLLHLGAKRKTSTRLQTIAGPAGGYAAVGEGFPIGQLCDLLSAMEDAGGLPDTVLFPLNMGDQAPLAALQGSFSQDGVPSKVQLGPAWWWCDHAMGIQNTLSSIASFGVVSQFIGMTTDSRSILSFVRHDYFRRLLCSWVDQHNHAGSWALSTELQGQMIQNIAYENAKKKLQRRG